MDLTNLQEYHDYFEDIATSHVDINDFHYGDEERLMEAARSNLSLPVLWLEPYQPVTVLDNFSDNQLGRVQGTVAVYMIPDSELHADEFTKLLACEGIIRDILGKMYKDWNDGTIMNELNNVRYGRSLDIIGATRLVGYRLDITILRPERLVYNEDKWA